MRHKTWAILAVAALAIGAPPAAAEEFSHSSGYSFTYPNGWVAVGDPGSSINPKEFSPEIQKWLRKNNFSMSQVSMVLLRQSTGDFVENLNVVVQGQQMPINDDSVKKLLQMLPQQYRAMGATVENLDARKRKFGANQAIELDYRVQLPGIATAIRQKQVFIPGGGNTYIVTCTAQADSFNDYSRTFETILVSFKVPTAAAAAPGGSGFVFITVVGGAIGCLVYLVKKFQGT
jgi:PsbP